MDFLIIEFQQLAQWYLRHYIQRALIFNQKHLCSLIVGFSIHAKPPFLIYFESELEGFIYLSYCT